MDKNIENGLEGYIRLQDHFNRILEEKEKLLDEKFRSNREAISLARNQVDHRLEGMNEFQKRMDKLEGTFATKDSLSRLEKIVYMGIGIVLGLQFVFRFLIK